MEDIGNTMDAIDVFVETITGIKNKMLAQGWSEANAEQVAIFVATAGITSAT